MFINMWVCNYGNESSLDWDKHLRLLLKFWGCVCMNIWAELLMLPLLARVCECVPALCVCVCVCVCLRAQCQDCCPAAKRTRAATPKLPKHQSEAPERKRNFMESGCPFSYCRWTNRWCVCEVWLSGSERGWPRGRTQTRASPSVSDPAPNWQRLSEPHTLQMCPVPFPSIPLSAPAPLSERRTAREGKQESGKKVNV